ncbi:Aste57867_20232 [Aphanomyces stellatus]|uniref:Aste57867_20232 protein n=1 Tax=Aphanomyces stellatus TaxID=120398 RepID=A0A485LG11_9STRA|nr:hypothetical protein As57867_020166 [Aphanomyces stellatus]VFT96924.1 Aste57867_20232 [Aphanomyces stellatus]
MQPKYQCLEINSFLLDKILSLAAPDGDTRFCFVPSTPFCAMVVICRALGHEYSVPNFEACALDVVRVLQTSNSYSDVPPIVSNLGWCLFFALACFILQTATGNYSYVDRLWSITPIVYAWNYLYVAWARGLDPDVRLVVVVMLVTQWGCRLTYNFYRKGGYRLSEEDYRWDFTRAIIPHPVAWHTFSFAFIAFYQHFLLFLITCPLQTVFKVWENKFKSDIFDNWCVRRLLLPLDHAQTHPLRRTYLDTAASLLFGGLLILETIADQQQWNYQQIKWTMLNKGHQLSELRPPYNLGFITTGTFAYSRHPNFFAEQGIWWSVYLFAVAANDGRHNWTFLGALLLTLLFQGSTRLTEYLTLQKYPRYAEYQQAVSMLVPLWPSSSLTQPQETNPEPKTAELKTKPNESKADTKSKEPKKEK